MKKEGYNNMNFTKSIGTNITPLGKVQVPGCSSDGLCTAYDSTCANNEGTTKQCAEAIAQSSKQLYSSR